MKICVLYSAYDQSDSPIKEHDTPIAIEPHLVGHDVVVAGIHKASAARQVRELVGRGFDLFVNLCDGSRHEDLAGIEVVQALERCRVPFTGAASDCYEPSRELTKRVCRANGLASPRHRFAASVAAVEEAACGLNFPLIVKHPESYCSIGMTRASRVETAPALAVEAGRMIRDFGSVLIEEFIEGREFAVLVAENADDPLNPVAFQPLEFVFPAGETFKHYDLKWIDYGRMKHLACADPELSERLRAQSRQLFVGLNASGYGRCDIRVNAAGEAFFLEINPNCGLFYPPTEAGSADLILLNEPDGYQRFLNLIFKAAFRRLDGLFPA